MHSRVPSNFVLFCPYSDCSAVSGPAFLSPKSGHIVRRGYYWRGEDSKQIRRYKCLRCVRSFSSSRWSDCFGQKKRRANIWIDRLLSNGVSERATARLLKLNRKTIARKVLFLALQAKCERMARLKFLEESPMKLLALQFDEMESFERSKCLPLSIPLAVVPGSREILSFKVVTMPANGLLAAISRKKYGYRKDERPKGAHAVFSELKRVLDPKGTLTSDQNPKYPGWIKKHFPHAVHKTVKGQRGASIGQGELKRVAFDPIFSLNHTAAMLRANINRLFRRTWCTTKRADRLEARIEIYARSHNRRVLEQQRLK